MLGGVWAAGLLGWGGPGRVEPAGGLRGGIRGRGAGAQAPIRRLVVGLLPFPVAKGELLSPLDGVVPGSPPNASSAG